MNKNVDGWSFGEYDLDDGRHSVLRLQSTGFYSHSSEYSPLLGGSCRLAGFITKWQASSSSVGKQRGVKEGVCDCCGNDDDDGGDDDENFTAVSGQDACGIDKQLRAGHDKTLKVVVCW